MPAQSEFDLFIQTREVFFKDLISCAGDAYIRLFIKNQMENEFFRDHSQMSFFHIHPARDAARKALERYYLTFIRLHDDYLHSLLTAKQIKRQAKSFLKNYIGQQGNQEAFKMDFEGRIRQLAWQPSSQFNEADYAPDSSDDEELAPEQRPHEPPHSSSIFSPIRRVFSSLGEVFFEKKVSEPMMIELINTQEEPWFLMEDDKDIEGFLAAFSTTDEPCMDVEIDLAPQPFDNDESSEPIHLSCFTYQRASTKRVTFFGLPEIDEIQLEHQPSIEQSMTDSMDF